MPTLSGSFGITGSITINGNQIVSGSQIISGSVTTTGPITSTGNQTISGDVVVSGSLTVSGSNTFTNIGPAIFQGPITASGDLRFPNTGSGVIQPINALTPTGTASFGGTFDNILTNTTTYLEYGINVVVTGSMTTSSYCVRLPQTPQKGKSVTIVNNDGVDLFVFPSTASGDINGTVDGYFTIPPDGKSYTFDCYENPLPGGWSSANIPNGNIVYNTGTITYNPSTTAQVLAFINQSTKVQGTITWAFSLISDFPPSTFGVMSNGGAVNAYFLPPNNWGNINSIAIRTNVTGSVPITLGLIQASSLVGYYAGTSTVANSYGGQTAALTTTLNNFSNQYLGTSYSSAYGSTSVIYFPFLNTTPGTFVSVPGNSNITANVGGPGTKALSLNINPNSYGANYTKKIGRNYITTVSQVYQWDGPYAGQFVDVDVYWIRLLAPVLFCSSNITNMKFRMGLIVTPN